MEMTEPPAKAAADVAVAAGQAAVAAKQAAADAAARPRKTEASTTMPAMSRRPTQATAGRMRRSMLHPTQKLNAQ
jgi:hypothetical protein